LILNKIKVLTNIANSNILFTFCNMQLRDKLRYLREVEGSLRGLSRPLTQAEVVRDLRAGHKKGISQSYLSQIESGKRPHMTNDTRALLAKYFKVHPGFLVDDPEGFHTELTSDLRTTEGRLDIWLLQGAEHFRTDHDVAEVLVKMARHPDTRSCIVLMGSILDTPGLAERLLEALGPEAAPKASAKGRAATSGRRRAR
jgi:transcriptional regulator with XRE-family HTH domain